MTFIEKLRNRWHSANSLVCVGLDPDPARFPEAFIDDEDALFSFCRDIVDATAEFACAFKPQIAYFAAHNGGEAQLQRLVAHINGAHPEIPVILDAFLAARVESATAGAEIRPGAEAAAGAGHDHRAHVVVRVDLVEQREPVVHHLRGEGVEPVGTVQGDGHHALAHFGQQRFVGPGDTPS